MKTINAIIATLFIISFLAPSASAASVTRSISPSTVSPEGTFEVTLKVDVSGGGGYYAIDDVYPTGCTVVSSGIGSTEHSGHWKHVIIQDAVNTEYKYTLKAPKETGSHSFSGEYMFGGMEGAAAISGQSIVSVTVTPTIDTTWTLIVTFLAIAFIAILVMYKRRG